MINEIVNAIKDNEKRMKKISSLKTYIAREQAEKYVRAECLARKVKLTETDIIHAAVLIAG
jgi:hypothetical protein